MTAPDTAAATDRDSPGTSDPDPSTNVWPFVAVVAGAVVLLAAGWWWRFGGEHITGTGPDTTVRTEIGRPVHIGVAITTEDGGEVTLDRARVRNVVPEEIATVEVGSVLDGDRLDTVIGADVAPLSFGPIDGTAVDGAEQYLVVSFLSDEPGVFTLDDVVVGYEAGFRRRSRVVEMCAIVAVTSADPATPGELSDEDAAIVAEADSTDC